MVIFIDNILYISSQKLTDYGFLYIPITVHKIHMYIYHRVKQMEKCTLNVGFTSACKGKASVLIDSDYTYIHISSFEGL